MAHGPRALLLVDVRRVTGVRRLDAVVARLLRFCARQVHLQQLYLDRHDVSGGDAITAARSLRWVGSVLAGDLLPDRGEEPALPVGVSWWPGRARPGRSRRR